MNKADLIERIYNKQKLFSERDITLAVGFIIEQMSEALANDERIEMRGFGTFTVHKLKPHTGRNPKTGELVQLGERRIPHFKPGKALKEKVNKMAERTISLLHK